MASQNSCIWLCHNLHTSNLDWLVVWKIFHFSHHIGNVIIPTDSYFSGVGQPPSSWENINAGGVSFYQSFTPKLPDTASVDCNLRRGGARKGSHTDPGNPGSKVWTKDGYCWLVICRWFCDIYFDLFCIILSFHGSGTCWNPTWLMVEYVCRSWSHQCHHCKTDMSESGSLPFFVVSIVDPTIKGAVFWWIWGNVVNPW